MSEDFAVWFYYYRDSIVFFTFFTSNLFSVTYFLNATFLPSFNVYLFQRSKFKTILVVRASRMRLLTSISAYHLHNRTETSSRRN